MERWKPGMNPQISLFEVAKGLVNDEFVYYYQPKISMVTGRVCGAEALIRWERPDGTIVTPARFVPLAESTGFITEITNAMVPKLADDIQSIHNLDGSLCVSFNLSAKDFGSPDIVDRISDAVKTRRLNSTLLEVELTETAMILYDNPAFRKSLDSLIRTGIGLAMDDFGTGYSSLTVLSRWPFTAVKLDAEIIGGMGHNGRIQTIVRNVITMAHQLDINVVAEGIESSQQYDHLLSVGCLQGQGFFMGKPMRLSDYLDYIRKEHRWSGLPVGLIYQAKLEHLRWMRLVTDEVIAGAIDAGRVSAEKFFTFEEDYTKCPFGRWFYNVGQEFKGLPEFDKLEEPHKAVHELAKILRTAVTEEKLDRRQIVTRLHELSHQSSGVVELLQDLENHARFRKLMPGSNNGGSALILS